MSKLKKKKGKGRPALNKPKKNTTPTQTRLGAILMARGMNNQDLITAIRIKTGRNIGKDRISKMINGLTKDYMLSTASAIASALNVKIDDIVEK